MPNTATDMTKFWNSKVMEVLEGKTIIKARYMNDAEMEQFGWYKRPICFFLSDGTQCVLSADDEGNDGGSLFYFKKGKSDDWVLPTL